MSGGWKSLSALAADAGEAERTAAGSTGDWRDFAKRAADRLVDEIANGVHRFRWIEAQEPLEEFEPGMFQNRKVAV